MRMPVWLWVGLATMFVSPLQIVIDCRWAASTLPCGWVVSTGAMPTWLGWWGVVAGIGLGLAELVWTVEAAWLVPYAAFWLWLPMTCEVLVRRTPSAGR